MFEYVNYYDVEKYICFSSECELYFIPYRYKEGIYKINEIDYLKYDSKTFENLEADKKKDILKKYMLWIKYPNYITNDFSQISVSDMEKLNIIYKNIDNDKIGMLCEIVNKDDKDDFYKYVGKDFGEYGKIVDECVDIIYNKFINKLENDYKKSEICKLFLDFSGDYDCPAINLTIVCQKDINNVLEKYSYEDFFNKNYKGLKLFKRFVSYKEDYEKYIGEILDNSGDYSFNDCVCHLNYENISRVISYYCSLFEYDKDYMFSGNFLYVVCNKVREKLINNLSKVKLSKEFKFYDVSEWD